MRTTINKILEIVLLMAVCLISGHALATEQPQGDQTSGTSREPVAEVPDLAEIIPLAASLSGRLADLENKVSRAPDLSELERKYAATETNLKGPAVQLERLKDSKDYSYRNLLELRKVIGQENDLLKEINKLLGKEISRLGQWRKGWLAEKKLWEEWQPSLLEESELEGVKSAFEKANVTIDRALSLLLPRLEEMLTVQVKAGSLQTKIGTLSAELEGLILVGQRSLLLDASPPMFSSEYFSQFGSDLLYAVQKGLDAITWPDSRLFTRYGWLVLFHGFLSLVVLISVYRNRRVLKESERWRFLASRPFSAGFFVGVMATIWIYEYAGFPASWEVALVIVGGISFARLAGVLIEASWKRQFVYGLVIVMIITRLIAVSSLPLPLMRLYTTLTALAGLFFCFRWAGESGRLEESRFYSRSLRVGSLFFGAIIIAELWGKESFSEYLFVSSIDSIITISVFLLFMYMIHGGLEWGVRRSFMRRAAALHKDTHLLIRRAVLFMDVAVVGLVLLPAILMVWGVYDDLEGATKGLLFLGFNLGSQRISIGLVLASAGVLYGSFLLSWILLKLFLDEVLLKRRVERGIRHAIERLIHYVIIGVGFLWALSILGLEITKLTIMLSALGVGIGFGLQGIVNNFVCGLILLFERPVRVGDIIEIGGTWAEIKRLGLRSTTVETFDQADVIIPNADLISNQVTNWTLSNRQVRLIVPVGVAYGSDVALVTETLLACAGANEKVSKTHAPQVLFLSFGESSLDVELRVWVLDVDNRLTVKSELHHEIDRSFREANIEIAFPQRDLHVRSIDDSVMLRQPDTAR